jgi:GNAT superfamily N-acetyltransferase
VNNALQIREITYADDLQELTALLHRAYAKLLKQGFRYVASHQDVTITKRRIEKGQCYLAFIDNKLIGTITYYKPGQHGGCLWYETPGIASFGQFAVEPEFQGAGVGGKLLEFVEQCARNEGANELALDTSEGAIALIAFYTQRGYRQTGYVQWKETNYRSIIFSKKLPPKGVPPTVPNL